MEYNEFETGRSCPTAPFPERGCSAWSALPTISERPRGTDYFRGKVADAEERVRAKKGSLENGRIRIYWFDLMPSYRFELGAWLEQEWGANVIMDFVSHCTYTIIDTSSEDSIFQGMAKRSLFDDMMVRQGRGRVDILLDDLVRVVKDYKMDCVIHPGYMGHKDQAASVGIVRDSAARSAFHAAYRP